MSSPAEWFASLPPVTKTWGAIMFAFALGAQVNLLDPRLLVFFPDLILKKFQVWRLLTSFLFAGGFSPPFAMLLLMIAQFGVKLEKVAFENRTADFLYMMIFSMTCMTLCGFFLPFFSFPVYSKSLIYVVVYLWSRWNANASVSLMGLVAVPGFYVPWAYMFLDMIFGQSIMIPLLGIIVGHIYYFLTAIYPRMPGGFELLTTPAWVHQLTAAWQRAAPQMFGLREPPPPAQRFAPPRPIPVPRPGVGGITAGAPAAAAAPAPAAGAAAGGAAAGAGSSGPVFRGRSYRLDRD